MDMPLVEIPVSGAALLALALGLLLGLGLLLLLRLGGHASESHVEFCELQLGLSRYL